MTKKDTTPKKVKKGKKEKFTLVVDGACGHCGKKMAVKLAFCDDDCKQAFLANNKHLIKE